MRTIGNSSQAFAYAIRQYNPKYIFIISNQGGIEKGCVDESKFIDKMQNILAEMRKWGDYIISQLLQIERP